MERMTKAPGAQDTNNHGEKKFYDLLECSDHDLI